MKMYLVVNRAGWCEKNEALFFNKSMAEAHAKEKESNRKTSDGYVAYYVETIETKDELTST